MLKWVDGILEAGPFGNHFPDIMLDAIFRRSLIIANLFLGMRLPCINQQKIVFSGKSSTFAA
jgi:hypothetical protein